VSGDLQPVFLAGATVEEVQKKDGSGSFFKISVGDRSIILNKPDVEFKEVRGGVNVTPTAYDKCQWKANAKPWPETLPPAGVRLPDRQKRKLDQAEEAAQQPAFEPTDVVALRSALVETLGTDEELHRRCEAYLAEHPNLRGLVTDDALLTLLAKDLALGVATRRSTTPARGKSPEQATTKTTATGPAGPAPRQMLSALDVPNLQDLWVRMQADARFNDAARGQVDNQIRYARIEKLLEQILAAIDAMHKEASA
jgi:hypothetical protein